MSEIPNTPENERTTLYIQAMQERMAQLVVEYEGKIAELRVEFTMLTRQLEETTKALNDFAEAGEGTPPN